jgi:hypothetical protein
VGGWFIAFRSQLGPRGRQASISSINYQVVT